MIIRHLSESLSNSQNNVFKREVKIFILISHTHSNKDTYIKIQGISVPPIENRNKGNFSDSKPSCVITVDVIQSVGNQISSTLHN